MRKLTRSWQIFCKSLTLIGKEKKLLIFPLLSACAMLLLLVFIIAGIAGVICFAANGSPEGVQAAFADSGTEEGNPALNAVAFAIFALVYLFCMTVVNFCNTAFFSEIIRGLSGENVSVSRGFGYALYRLKAIFLWSLLASTVGIVLSVLERRAGLVGRIVLKLIGVVWAVASVFAIPALVCDAELTNPFTALKRSASIIRRTWGETLIGFAGLHVITGVGVFLFFLAVFGVGGSGRRGRWRRRSGDRRDERWNIALPLSFRLLLSGECRRKGLHRLALSLRDRLRRIQPFRRRGARRGVPLPEIERPSRAAEAIPNSAASPAYRRATSRYCRSAGPATAAPRAEPARP